VFGPLDKVLEKCPGLAHFSKLVSTGLRSTAIFTFFASRYGELIVIGFLLKTTIYDFCSFFWYINRF
jgi:hypothetical protein